MRNGSLSPIAGRPSQLDVDDCRSHFANLANGWVYLDNAGGSYVPASVVSRVTEFLNETKNHPYSHFAGGALAADRIEDVHENIAAMINAYRDEIVLGASTTAHIYMLAQALRPTLQAGDEIIVTDQDHEANNGAWRRLSEFGIRIVEWKMDPSTGLLDVEDLRRLLGGRTRLVCFTHVSNIIAAINPVAEITSIAHSVGARVVVDGVAFAGHAAVDVKAWDVDYYLFSLYKIYGLHLGVLFGKRDAIRLAANQGHFFYEDAIPAKLHPAGDQYEVVGAAAGIADYFNAVYAHHASDNEPDLRVRTSKVFDLFGMQEDAVARRLASFLASRPEIRLLGPQTGDRTVRMPTFAFLVDGWSSRKFAETLAAQRFAIAFGSFYSPRCLAALGLGDVPDGVARISILHYNSMHEIETLIAAITTLLDGN